MKKNICILLLHCIMVIGVIPFTLDPAWAIKIQPIIRLKEEFTDNLYLMDTNNEEKDYLTTVEGGFFLSEDHGNKKYEVLYLGNSVFHKNNPREDRWAHTGTVHVDYGMGDKKTLSANLHDVIYYKRVDTQRPEVEGNLTRIRIVTMSPTFRLLVGKGGLDVGFHYRAAGHEDPHFTDDYNKKGFIKLDQDIGRRLSLSCAYSHVSRHYVWGYAEEYEPDYEEDTVDAGIKVEMPLDIKGALHYGYAWRKYDATSDSEYYTMKADVGRDIGRMITAGFSYGIGEYTDVGEYQYGDEGEYHNWEGRVKICVRKRHVLEADHGEGYYQDMYGMIYKRRDSMIGIKHEFEGKYNISYGWHSERDAYEDVRRKDSSYGGKGSCEIFLTGRLSLLLEGEYIKKNFEPEGRKDRYMKESVGFTYNPPDWVSLSISYSYSNNKSNYPEEEYTNNSYAIEVKGSF